MWSEKKLAECSLEIVLFKTSPDSWVVTPVLLAGKSVGVATTNIPIEPLKRKVKPEEMLVKGSLASSD